jgi:hypothetical protein
MKPLFSLVVWLAVASALPVFSLPAFAQEAGVAIAVQLSPAGNFIAKTEKVHGFAYQTGSGFAAQNVLVDLRTITTGIGLRDKHTKEHLMVEKYPEAKLIKAIGKNGSGEALVEIKGQKLKVKGTYSVAGNVLKAKFPIHLPDLKITGIRYMGVGVKDDVIVNVTLPVRSAPASAANTSKKGH